MPSDRVSTRTVEKNIFAFSEQPVNSLINLIQLCYSTLQKESIGIVIDEIGDYDASLLTKV